MVVTDVSTATLVSVLVSVVLPLVVGLVTKASWSASVKAILLAALSAVTGVATTFLAATPEHPFVWQVAALNAVIAWVIAVATHFGLWKAETNDGNSVAKVVQATFVKDTPTVGEHEMPDAA